MNVECYRNRFGGFGIVPTDSTMIGEAVDLACCRTEKQAEELVRKLNSHDALLAACQCACAAIAQYQAVGRKCDRDALDVVFATCENAIALATGIVDEMKPATPEFYRKLDAQATGNKIPTPQVSENLNQPLAQ